MIHRRGPQSHAEEYRDVLPIFPPSFEIWNGTTSTTSVSPSVRKLNDRVTAKRWQHIALGVSPRNSARPHTQPRSGDRRGTSSRFPVASSRLRVSTSSYRRLTPAAIRFRLFEAPIIPARKACFKSQTSSRPATLAASPQFSIDFREPHNLPHRTIPDVTAALRI